MGRMARSVRNWTMGLTVIAVALSSIACEPGLGEEGETAGEPQMLNGGIETAKGDVAALDAEAQTLSIEETSGRTIEVRTNQATVITVDGVPASLRDVPHDATSEVTFDKSRNMAVRIVVTTIDEEAETRTDQLPDAAETATPEAGAQAPGQP